MIMTQPKSCLRRTETSLSRYSDDVFSVTITPRGTPTPFRRSESSFALLKRSQPSSLQFPKVEATNVNRDDKLKLSRLGQRIRRDPHRAISIDESPIMLLPKANVRNDYDIRASKRAFNVVADDELSTFHLSTVPLDREEIKSSRSVSRSSMKSRKSLQSETDSGFGSSLRRCVTFSELSLSRSTIARSLDDIEKSSELEDVNNNNLKNINMLDSLFGPLPETEDDGGHLDSFADVIPDPPKIRKKQKDNAEVEDQRCTLTETDVKRCHEQDCEICKGFASEHTRIQRYFGGVDQFLQWLYSKWGKKRTELLTYSRANYLSRGNRPKFCDIVRQKELHYRDEEDRSESSEYNYYRQQGHLLTRWRKHSNARPKNSRKSRSGIKARHALDLWLGLDSKEGRGGTEGRPGSPTSTVDGTDNQPDPPKEEESEPVVETKPDIITPSVIDIPDSKSDISSSSAQPQLTSVDIRVIITGKPSTKTDSKDDKKKTEPISVPSDRDGRQSPVQPPPSPEPRTPKEDPNKDADLLKSLREAEEEEERRRRALIKKEKKPIHRTRKPKEEMEEKVEPPKPATPPPPPQPIEDTVTLVQQWKNKDIKVDLEVPSLPTFEDKKKDKKEKRKADRHLVSQPKHETPPPKDPEPLVLRTPLEFPKEEEVDLDDLDDQLKQRLKNFDFNIMEMMGEDSPRKNVQKATWVTGRLALSQQSSRFTLPIDMARLEQMTPLDYVKNFCIIKRRRKKLYQDIFVKHKDKTGQIPFKDLEKALTMVLVNTLTSDDYKRIVELLDISDSTRVDVDGFSAMAALAERLMCSTHVSQEQVDQPDYQKEKIECADFSALEWKLTGVQVNPKIVRILKELN
ncbi:protein piccolo isoform X14 [Magallana gigas]|uniref:protein piccolo isoform X14 n=1 Tax=Magallana gigas TaxID=29159 RepID=UPI00333FAA5E